MNLYFLVEGKRTESKVYPKWLTYLIPSLNKVKYLHEIKQNNYYLFSGNGFPSLLDNHLKNCIEDINENGNFDYFVICLDSDEMSIVECKNEIETFMNENKIQLNSKTKFEIIVQNKCLETWFLGNAKVFKKNPVSSKLKEYIDFYNVKENDPELMEKPSSFEESVSIFHSKYLSEILSERSVSYSKNNPYSVREEYYLKELKKRISKTNHLNSFKFFIEFCNEINKQIE